MLSNCSIGGKFYRKRTLIGSRDHIGRYTLLRFVAYLLSISAGRSYEIFARLDNLVRERSVT